MHSLETGTPTRAQPHSANDGWRKVTLTVPNGKCSNDEPPVAPPRRKRSSVVDRQPCGFKELFGNNVSRRSSCDSILDHPLTEREQEMLQQKRKSKSISDFNMNDSKATTDSLSISTIRIPVTRTLSLMDRSMAQQSMIPMPRPTLQRKVSRVGNKKSDKFFGSLKLSHNIHYQKRTNMSKHAKHVERTVFSTTIHFHDPHLGKTNLVKKTLNNKKKSVR